MVKGPRKSPDDYPVFTFRCSDDEKSQLNEMIEGVRVTLNKKQSPDQKLWLKNDVIIEAIRLGLPLLKKTGNRGQG